MKKTLLSLCASSVLLTGCTVHTDHLYVLNENYLQERQQQTRRFETKDEELILSSSAHVLQDLGFTLTESETKMGLLTASKERDAKNGGQIAGAILLAALTGARMPMDTVQTIHATVVSSKSKTEDGYLVRAKFARVIFNDMGGAKIEVIQEPEIYQEFFNKLSESAFLTANDI